VAIICHCSAVKERAIVKAIHHGASSIDDVRNRCGAATQCGGCEDAVVDLLARHGAPNPPIGGAAVARLQVAVGRA
jgi:NAD(P)H-nitrite reductase large subunit